MNNESKTVREAHVREVQDHSQKGPCNGDLRKSEASAETGLSRKWRCFKSMARIAGIDLPKDKRIEIGLTYIYGIGRKSAQDILAQTGINPDTRVKDLTEAEEAKLREAIDQSYTVEGDLRRQVALDIKRLTEIGCYRGTRHRRGLPVRGQRSKTNARTRKGPKKTIANKKK